jgi:hypothetical protein
MLEPVSCSLARKLNCKAIKEGLRAPLFCSGKEVQWISLMQQLISKLTQTALVLLTGAALLICNRQAIAANGTGAFGGLSISPTAQVEGGTMTFQVQNRVIGTGRYDGINLTNVFGLSDFLEVGGRIAANTTNVNLYAGDGGNRDLSASAKLQLNPILGYAASPFKFSLGATDVGGAATLFRTYYGVASYAGSGWSASAGYAKAGENNIQYNPLKGAFINGSLSIKPWLDVQAESTSERSWLALAAKNDTLLPSWGAPAGTAIYAKINSQVRGSNLVGGSPWLDVGIRLPLDWTQIKQPKSSPDVPARQPAQANNNVVAIAQTTAYADAQAKPKPHEPSHVPPQVPPQAPSKDQQSMSQFAQDLAQRLVQSGLEGVSVGVIGDMLIVKASDMVYEHSLLDGAGVALGQMAQNVPEQINQYRYVHARWGTPAIGFTGDIRCLKDWLERGNKCMSLDVAQPVFRNLSQWTTNVPWEVQNLQDIRYKPRVKLNTVQNYYAATEFSLLDYSIGVNVQPSMLLWEGGSLEASKIYHLQSTSGFNRGEVFNFTRIRDGMNSIVLTHIQKLKDGFSGRINVGQIGTGFYKGGHAELRWDSLDGQYAAGLNQGYWMADNERIQAVGRPATVYARYAPPLRDWTLEMVAGRYWYGDKGFSVVSGHWVGDVKMSMFVRRSFPPEQYWPGKRGATFAGLEVSFPLTPRRAMNAESYQVKGSPRFGLSLSTPVGRTDNYIVDPFGVPIYVKALVDSPVGGQLGSVIMDYDRNGPAYVFGHLERLRYAYEKWVKKD